MRGKQGLCILRQNYSQSPQITSIARRAASSRSRHDTFDASKLVLDLDAADSKYVRRYEDERLEDSEPEEPQRHFLSSRQKAKKRKQEAVVPGRQKTISDIYRATDADYLAFALLGDPFTQPSRFSTNLRAVLSQNLLSTRVGNFKQQIYWLKDNADRPNIPSLPNSIPSAHRHELYSYMILDCRTVQHLSRATAFITQTKLGCEWISSNGNVIVEAIKRLRRSQDFTKSIKVITSGQILKYINALVQKLETLNLDPGSALCHAGMHYAAKEDIYSAVKKYVDMAADKGHEFKRHRETALGILLRRNTKEPWGQPETQRSSRWKDGRRADLLRLLTGWDTDGAPKEGEERKPCFASLAEGKVQMYWTYITGLGQLGAHKALWFELLNPQLMPASQDGSPMITSKERADIFFNAFLAASGISVSLAKMGNSAAREPDPDTTGLTNTIRSASDAVKSPGELKDRKELVEYFQSRLRQLQEDLVRDDANGHQDALLVLEKLLKKEGIEFEAGN